MYVNTRYILVLVKIYNLFLFISANDAISLSKDRSGRHLFSLLGYLHGYKIGKHFALQLPPFVLSPVIILPSVNQQQSVNVQKSSAEENYQESGGIFQNISPARFISSSVESNSERNHLNQSMYSETTKIVENLIFENNSLLHSEIDTFKQANINETDVTVTQDIDEYLTTTPYAEATVNESDNFTIENVTKSSGPYANAAYNNENISTLSIITEPLQYNLTVPDPDDRWQNFSNTTNGSINDVKNAIFNPSREFTFITKPYPYPRSWYNAKVDRLSIMTNSYTNEDTALPPSYDDRWQRFSSLRKSYLSSGFRPLAGLYYDGFLHKSLSKEMGFKPYRNNGYYYN